MTGFRRFLAALLLASPAASNRLAAVPASRDLSFAVTFGGRRRTYLVHLPPQYDGVKLLPAVFNLHGGGGDGAAAAKQTQMNLTADKFGFIVVYPEGTAPSGSKAFTWNAGSCCAYAVEQKVDDIGFLRELAVSLPKQFNIDARRLYCTGMSNGAMMSYRVACELSQYFAAICAVSASMGVDGPLPARPIPVLEIHGALDTNAPYDGGIGSTAISRVQHHPVEQVLAWWRAANRCAWLPRWDSTTPVYRWREWVPRGEGGAPVSIYKLPGGGHTWPGGVDVTKGLGTGPLVKDFPANEVMWRFFERFALPAAAAVAA
jgi:polyhydroxybutyrate depolymerase